MIAKILWIAKAIAPAAAGLGLGGPAGAILAVAGQLGGKAGKRGGDSKRVLGGSPADKVAGPVGALAAPSALAALLVSSGVPGAEDIAAGACGDPAAVGASYGMLATVVHQLFAGLSKTVEARRAAV